jgi:hypothetical protein
LIYFHKIIASEVRSWLLYYCLPVLKGILPDDLYCHYALLATSVYLLLQQPVTQAGIMLADKQINFIGALKDTTVMVTVIIMMITDE